MDTELLPESQGLNIPCHFVLVANCVGKKNAGTKIMITSSGTGAARTHHVVDAPILRLHVIIYSNMFKLLAQEKYGKNWKRSQVTQYKSSFKN